MTRFKGYSEQFTFGSRFARQRHLNDHRGWSNEIKVVEKMIRDQKNIWIGGVVKSPIVAPELYYMTELFLN